MRKRCEQCRSQSQGTLFWKSPQIGRRMFFRSMATAIGGYFLWPSRDLQLAALSAAPLPRLAKYCIFIYTSGAPSQVDTFDFKDGGWMNAGLRREFNPTKYGDLLFPQGLMPAIARNIDSISLVRSVEAWALLHPLAASWMQLARNPQTEMAKISPHLGCVIASEVNPSGDGLLPAFVSLNAEDPGMGPGFLPAVHAPFYVYPDGSGLLAATHGGQDDDGNNVYADPLAVFRRRYSLADQLSKMAGANDLGSRIAEVDGFRDRAKRLTESGTVNQIFKLAADERMRYGNNSFGDACLTARNLIAANQGVRMVQITMGAGFEWDHHAAIYTDREAGLIPLAKQFDGGLGGLIEDLRKSGTLKDTLIVVMGEFGRTGGDLTDAAGRDHSLVQTVLFAGAGVRGGRAIGKTDATGDEILQPGWKSRIGERNARPEDVAATIYRALGIDYAKSLATPLGRDFEYVPGAKDGAYEHLDLWS